MIKNILTVDLEDWFVVENLKDHVSFDKWDKLPKRVEETTARLLEIFDYYNVRATFFTLGWIAEKHPHLINMVASFGHEIGCHSYQHNRIDKMGKTTFRKDTTLAVEAIYNACGIVPIGYRAPSWSINSSILWAYEVLADLGFAYDSSIYPIKHDIYGEPGGPKRVFRMDLKNGKSIFEIPASTVKIFGKDFPVGGGGYLRHSPLWFTSRMINKLNQNNQPAVIYIHPWEIDKDQPRMENLSAFQKYRQYGSIDTLQRKLELILKKFDFCSAGDYIEQIKRRPIGFDRVQNE
ncbi:MAG: XrtA system polysaccharide deacetylase [Candidatus Zixiibacteriota bacterium]